MKKLFLLALLCALCGRASATDVTISAQTLSALPFNPTDAGADQTFAVTVTSGSPTVTTATPIFPTAIVGKSGFQVSIGGTQYVVASVASRSSLTLMTNYGGLTGSAQLTLYKFVLLRVYANRAFQPLGSNEVVQPGGPSTGQFYKEVGVSILNSGSGNVAYIPEFVLPATTDALITNQARYTFVFFRSGGSQLGIYDCGVGKTELQLPPNSPATFAFICNYNSAGGIAPASQEAYPKTYINEIHPNCTAGQMDYYSITGQKKSCLTVGSGLQISGGVLSATGGGGGGGGIGGSGTLNYVPVFTSSSTIASSNLIYSTASQLFQFGYSVDIQAGGLSQLTLETDQVVFKGGVSRANNAIMQAMKATASQTGPFQRFTDSTGSIKFEVDVDGDVKPRGVNYTWPLVTGNGAMINTSGTLSWVPFNSSYFSTSGSITPKGLATAINPKTDHGCVGDDTADDTTCLTNAIAAAAASTGKYIKLDAGTYKTTAKLTIPGNVVIEGDGREKTIIHGTANDVILDLVQGSGAYAFKGPTLRKLGVKGSASGSGQIGINVNDALYVQDVVLEDIKVDATGSHGVYFGNVFSSTFKRVLSGGMATGYPFLFNQLNMPGNTFEGLYAGDVNSTHPAGFRVRTGDILCIGCNGINNSGSNSWWAIIGDKSGTDGALSNRSAYFKCLHCNVESSKAGGILHYYNSTSDIDGRSLFAGDGSASGSYIALKYEVVTSGGEIPPYFQKGRIGPLVTFANSPLSYYANSEVIHANDLPPVAVEGDLRQADGTIITSYRNTTNSRSEKLYRLDGRKPVVTITGSATFMNPGATNYEANCSSPCTLSLPWPGYNLANEELTYIRNIGSATVTVNANSGGTINGSGSYALAVGESVLLLPHSASADYRQVSVAGAGANTRLAFWDSTQHLTSSSNLTYDGTVVLNQRAGGNPYFAANDTTNGITTRFGPLAGAPDRAFIGTISNHPFGLYANNAERWTIGVSGHLTPGAANSYDLGSASLPVRSGYFGTALNLGIASSVTGQLVLSNSGTANTTTLQAGAPASSIAITLPATLPASAGCLQIGSTGVITQTGSACGGGGGATAWSAITDPGAALSLAMAAYTTTITYGNATGSSVNMWTMQDTASNTGTGYVLALNTAASSAAKPVSITAGGTANGVEMTTGGVLQVIGSGGILATTGDSATAFFSTGQIEAARGGTGVDTSGSTGVLRVNAGTWSANAGISHLASSTSADLRGTLSDETGTGAAVFAGGNIGAATATSLNGLSITNTTGTLTIANGKTLTYNNSVALSGTDGTTMTFPATSATLAGLSITQTFTGVNTFNPGTTPTDAVLLDIAAIGAPGQRDSHNLVFRGRANNGSAHTAEWKQFVDVTANAGTSQLVIGSSLDGGSFSNWLTIADSGDVSLGNVIGNSATFGSAVSADTLSAGTSLAVTGTSTMREIDPQTDNTYDLGTTALRWKTLHVGPGSVVVHNDATNTLKATLGFASTVATLSTDAASPLQLKVGSSTGVYFNTSGKIGFGTTGTPDGDYDFRQLANGTALLNLRRFTDTTPSGALIQAQNAAGVVVYNLDVTGTMTIGTIPAARISSGTIAPANGGTGQDTSGSSGMPLITAGTWSVISTTGSGNAVRATSPTIAGGAITALASLGIRSSGTGAFDLTLANTENLTAGRTLTITLNDAARTLNLGGNLTTAAAFTTSGANALTLTTTGPTNVTLPTTGTLASLAGSEALMNKTVNGLTITSSTGTLTVANGKTATISNTLSLAGTDGTTITFQGTDTYVGRATTDTLTNKTISGASNTLANIGNASLTNSTITIAGTATSLGNSISLDTITGLSSTGLVKRTGANTFAIAVAGTDYLATNQTITLSGDISGSGTTAITTTIGASKVTNAMLAGSITDDKLNQITTADKVADSALSTNVPLLNGANTFTAAPQSVSVDNSTNSSVTKLIDLIHNTTGTPAIGLGAGIRFGLESSGTINRDAGQINVQWTTVTDLTRTASMTFQLVNSAASLATMLTIAGNGDLSAVGNITSGGVAVPTISSTSTFTNKTLTSSTNVLGGVTMTLGSDATGDMYWRSGGVLTRLGIGSTSADLMVVSGAPAWKRRVFNIIAYGAVCDGSTTNDRAAIQAAIDAAGAAGGGVVSFEGCTSGTRIDTGLTVGDGSGTYSTGTATASTYNDITIDGASSKLRWYGSAGGTIFTVNGPFYRLKIRDLFINMKPSTNAAGIGLDLNHVLLSEFSNVYINENSDYGIRLRAYGGWSGGDGANGNKFDNITINSTTSGAKGIDIGYTAICSGCTLDPAQNQFNNFRARFDTGVGTYVSGSIGINLNFTDASQFNNPIIAAATALQITVPTGTGGASYPSAYMFTNPALTGTSSFAVSGTWTATEKLGFYNYEVGDAETIPSDTNNNTFGITSNGVPWNMTSDAGFITGLQLEWVSTTQVKIKTGAAQIQSTGEIVTLASDSTISPTLSASAWHYCYLYLSSGTPTVECVTTAPATAWFGTARSKTSATGRRYIGAIKTNGSSQIYEFYHNAATNFYQWGEVTTASPFRVLPGGIAATETSVDCTAVVPATGRAAQLRMINTEPVGGQNSFIRSRTGGPNQLQLRVNSDLITPIVLTSAQLFYYIYGSAPSTGATYIDVVGYYDNR